jgi:hypothetical protein
MPGKESFEKTCSPNLPLPSYLSGFEESHHLSAVSSPERPSSGQVYSMQSHKMVQSLDLNTFSLQMLSREKNIEHCIFR